MNKRKLQRSKLIKTKKTISDEMIISIKAHKTAMAARTLEPSIDCIGNFIFFSTSSGQAWMLDHRNSYALRLADNGKLLPYRIIETKERFQVEWKERFRINDDVFIISDKEQETVIDNCPVDAIEALISMIKQKDQQ